MVELELLEASVPIEKHLFVRCYRVSRGVVVVEVVVFVREKVHS